MLSLKLDKIDARGLSCPQPVLLTKKGIENLFAIENAEYKLIYKNV
jgi:TusA-related sulfurtransferase